jgi:hypothetical protein
MGRRGGSDIPGEKLPSSLVKIVVLMKTTFHHNIISKERD